MSKQADFFIYLLERYAKAKQTSAQQVLARWDSLELTDLIYGMYELYHVERLENAFDDIDSLVLEQLG
jgi:acyl carrier protein